MPSFRFREAFSLSGVYYPAGTTHSLSDKDSAAVPPWVVDEVDEDDVQITEGGQTTGAKSTTKLNK